MSRGALQKMLPKVDECVTRYADCWAGDIRLALCLRDINILVNAKTNNVRLNFHGDAPYAEKYSWPSDPCEVPLTYHHLIPRRAQDIYETERSVLYDETVLSKLKGRENITTADVFHSLYVNGTTLRRGNGQSYPVRLEKIPTQRSRVSREFPG